MYSSPCFLRVTQDDKIFDAEKASKMKSLDPKMGKLLGRIRPDESLAGAR
jgi:hypothetical protein